MSRIRNKYRAIRKEFRKDLYCAVVENNALGMLIIETYTASQHRKHIMKIWSLLRNHKAAKRDYNDNLFGKHLTGTDEIMKSLYFANRSLYDKYVYKLPESLAMGDALAVAYKAMKR